MKTSSEDIVREFAITGIGRNNNKLALQN